MNYKLVDLIDKLEENKQLIENYVEKFEKNDNFFNSMKIVFCKILEDLNDVSQRAKTGVIRIGILGGRGSGKSTLANVLMGQEILPNSSTVFCTNIPTVIKYSQKFSLLVESDIEKYRVSTNEITPNEMKKILQKIGKESENPKNEKKIRKILIGIPEKIFKGKELVDVPGFTKGNPLHQAFAENYAKYYCDLSIVLINNSESIQLGELEGLEALAKCFLNKSNSTIFAINKCDNSGEEDIKYLKRELKKFLMDMELTEMPEIRKISAINSLNKSNKQFDILKLYGDFNNISEQKYSYLIMAFLERQISNLFSLKELFELAKPDIMRFKKDLIILRKSFKNYYDELQNQCDKFKDEKINPPEFKVEKLNLPYMQAKQGANQYLNILVSSITKHKDKIDLIISEYQAEIYTTFNQIFQKEVDSINNQLIHQLKLFENKFGLKHHSVTPIIRNDFNIRSFDPIAIEKLKPSTIKLFLEKIFNFDSILLRDIKFWKSPVSIPVGFMTIDIGIPIGLKRDAEKKNDYRELIPQQAVKIINQHLITALDKFAKELDIRYAEALNDFINKWDICLSEYLERVNIAQNFSEVDNINEISKIIERLKLTTNDIKKSITK